MRKRKRRSIHPKVMSLGIGGSIATLLVGLLERKGITLQADEITALSVIICAIVAWHSPERYEQTILDEVES